MKSFYPFRIDFSKMDSEWSGFAEAIELSEYQQKEIVSELMDFDITVWPSSDKGELRPENCHVEIAVFAFGGGHVSSKRLDELLIGWDGCDCGLDQEIAALKKLETHVQGMIAELEAKRSARSAAEKPSSFEGVTS